ncbi:efflux RND transporter periplasmic adaptor subunit [Engelhardtia mirabilis]|uniref:Multidrug resistance protein MdtA n=1 Tax=Engelhardtia mirabilis TaxID=2528011 RepID=A0A518BE14_9BACT|nr:Multidrug resistance protein MdtA precursor [Planctomycetes bacterium Pla133]QDU99532.1 Multidrug resistance protein MdtA precursor [Planctomycetes bacterium Pla86]
MKSWPQRIVVLALLGGLVLALLWFQGIIGRHEYVQASIPAGQAVAATTRTQTVQRERITDLRVYPGFVEAVDPATLAARVMGTVVELRAREGDRVAAGEIVATLDDRDARAQLAQARAALDAAGARALQSQLALDRIVALGESDAITAQDLEGAQAARDAGRAQEVAAEQAVAEAETALTWFQLAAPFDGRVLERQAEAGDLALPGRALLTLYRGDRLRLRLAVPEQLVAGLEPGADLHVDFDGLPSRSARLARILPPADAMTGTVIVHLDLEPSGDLRPGAMGRVGLAVGEREALLIPAAAVERIGQVQRVGLVREGRIQSVTVRIGKRIGERVEVLDGLAAGEQVVLP